MNNTIPAASVEALIEKWQNSNIYRNGNHETHVMICGCISDLRKLLPQPAPPPVEEVGQYGITYVAQKIPEGVMVEGEKLLV